MKPWIIYSTFLMGFVLLVIQRDYSYKKVSWLNDQIYYTTNLVLDTERNKQLPTNSPQLYVFPVVVTNKQPPFYIRLDNVVRELGARNDGVIVWKTVK